MDSSLDFPRWSAHAHDLIVIEPLITEHVTLSLQSQTSHKRYKWTKRYLNEAIKVMMHG